MPDVDLAAIEQPDELIRAAWNAGFDRKLVIREGTDAAMLLLAGERSDFVTLFWPVPRPLEGVDRWSENSSPVAGTSASLRPFASAVLPGCAIGFVTWRLSGAPLGALWWIILASIVVLGVVFKVLIDRALRRRVARLDEEAALGLVLDQLRRGMAVCPRLVPRAATWIRRGLGVESGPAGPLAERR